MTDLLTTILKRLERDIYSTTTGDKKDPIRSAVVLSYEEALAVRDLLRERAQRPAEPLPHEALADFDRRAPAIASFMRNVDHWT